MIGDPAGAEGEGSGPVGGGGEFAGTGQSSGEGRSVGGSLSAGGGKSADSDGGFGRVLVERSGGIGGFLLVWDLDIDASARRDEIGPRIAELPWTGHNADGAHSGDVTEAGAGRVPAGADRYAYLIESRYGQVRFGEGQMPEEWKRLVDTVRESTEPERRRPGTD